MRFFTFICLLAILSVLPDSQAAPAPKNAKPAVINAGTEKNIAWVLESVAMYARIGARENKEVANLDIVRRQKDLDSWLKKNLRVGRVKGKKLVQVRFQDGNAKEQVAIINAVVDYYLKHDVKDRQDVEVRSLERIRDSFNAMRRSGKLTAKQVANGEEGLKKREEYIRTLPALVEHAEAP